jgi:tetratricopeptide (TPR) repeat protein
LQNTKKAKEILEQCLTFRLNNKQMAEVKMDLADVLLLEEKFSMALLQYAQVEEDMKGDVLGQEANLKMAKTSFYQQDFEWALQQFKVLKSAHSQLIANDALELFLLINDNTVADSTQTALKLFAKADFLVYQNKKEEALQQFQAILKDHQSEDDVIADVTLLRLGELYEALRDIPKALASYQNIIDNFPESIYRDEALYFSAEIYHKNLQLPDKAKALYEALLFNHQDSIYFVDARKKYRLLRGDSNL